MHPISFIVLVTVLSWNLLVKLSTPMAVGTFQDQGGERLKIAGCLFLVLLTSLCTLHGCGGGSANSPTGTASQSRTATVKLSTQGSGSNLSGIQLTVHLPDGVTINASDGVPQTGAVKASGVAPADSTLAARYLPASGSTPGQLTIILASTTNFPSGEFATVSCELAAGKTLTSDMLTFTGYRPVDGSGRSVLADYPSVTADVTVN